MGARAKLTHRVAVLNLYHRDDFLRVQSLSFRSVGFARLSVNRTLRENYQDAENVKWKLEVFVMLAEESNSSGVTVQSGPFRSF